MLNLSLRDAYGHKLILGRDNPVSPFPHFPVSPFPRFPVSPYPRLPVSPSPRLPVSPSRNLGVGGSPYNSFPLVIDCFPIT